MIIDIVYCMNLGEICLELLSLYEFMKNKKKNKMIVSFVMIVLLIIKKVYMY